MNQVNELIVLRYDPIYEAIQRHLQPQEPRYWHYVLIDRVSGKRFERKFYANGTRTEDDVWSEGYKQAVASGLFD